jgi:hypothetical protein
LHSSRAPTRALILGGTQISPSATFSCGCLREPLLHRWGRFSLPPPPGPASLVVPPPPVPFPAAICARLELQHWQIRGATTRWGSNAGRWWCATARAGDGRSTPSSRVRATLRGGGEGTDSLSGGEGRVPWSSHHRFELAVHPDPPRLLSTPSIERERRQSMEAEGKSSIRWRSSCPRSLPTSLRRWGKAPYPERRRPPSSSIRRRSSPPGRRRTQSELVLGHVVVLHLARAHGRPDPQRGARVGATSAVVGELRGLPPRSAGARAGTASELVLLHDLVVGPKSFKR